MTPTVVIVRVLVDCVRGCHRTPPADPSRFDLLVRVDTHHSTPLVTSRTEAKVPGSRSTWLARPECVFKREAPAAAAETTSTREASRPLRQPARAGWQVPDVYMLRDLRLWRYGLLAALDVVVDSYWFPAYGHPDGASPVPWFRVVDGWGYRTEHNPAGESQSPSFRLVDEWAYPT